MTFGILIVTSETMALLFVSCRRTTIGYFQNGKKIALFCNLSADAVITAKDVSTVYEVPLVFHKEGLDDKVIEYLNMWTREPDLSNWEWLVSRVQKPKRETTIAIVGKYVDLVDSYKSLNAALMHAGVANDAKVHLKHVDSEAIEEKGVEEFLAQVDGVLVPGGFGSRGVEGKVQAIKYAREKKIPFFGICLGMQCAVIEVARHLADLNQANSIEFDEKTPHEVIHLMESQKDVTDKGATMRLGAYPCKLEKGSLAQKMYQESDIDERHRHRYEVNNDYREPLAKVGLKATGVSPSGELVEIMELEGHPWFLGCQFHPEFQSTPFDSHPLFKGFIEASLNRASETGSK